MTMCRKMRALLEQKEYLATPAVTNSMQALILEKAGFEFAYIGGYGISLTQLGAPDVGLQTETEIVTNVRNIARSVKIPLLADADTGFGNAINVIRTVEDFEAAGAVGIHIEDQESPRRCGHLAGKTLIPMEEAVGKIRAALDAKKDKNFILIARTDAIAAVGGGFEEAVRRGKAYAHAGADMVFCEFNSPAVAEPKRFAEEIHKDFPNLPLLFNYSSSFKWYDSPLKFRDLSEMGYKVILVSMGCLRVSLQAVWDYAVDMVNREEMAEIDFETRLKGHPTEDFHKFAGFPAIKELESKYLPAEEVWKKYGESLGYKGD